VNLDQIIAGTWAEVRDPTGAFVTNTDVVRYANEAQVDLVARLHLLDAEHDGTTDGTNLIPLPPDYIEARSLRIGTEDFSFVDDDTWWSLSDLGASAPPFVFRVFGSSLELYPTPANATAYKVRYWRKPVPLILNETAAPIATTAGSAAAEIATITTASAHNLTEGDWVDVVGVTPTAYNGTWRVLSTPSGTQFTAHIGSTPAVISVQGTVEETDVPEVAEELHKRILDFCIGRALLKVNEGDKGALFLGLYEDGLPPAPTSKTRTIAGPLVVIPSPNAFDLDFDARHY
jgi:hypothetical protein